MLLPLPSTCYNIFSIEMINLNYMTHLDHVVRIIITWSEWRESNPRPHGPEPCARPTALHPDTALPLYGIRFGMSRHIAENPRIELKEFNDGGQEG